MSNLLASAYKYISNGICVIATNSQKRAVMQWKQYQDIIITNEQAEIQFEHPSAEGLAVVCGKPSGKLEVLDIDQKYCLTGDLFTRFMQGLFDHDAALHDRLYVTSTVGGGYHIYYRCETIEGNQKLASRHTTDEERAADPNDKVRVLIETRGQGGYVIAPPTAGYKRVQGEGIPTITPEERGLLIELARSFNEVIEEPTKTYTSQGYNPKEFGLSPFEDYNKRGDVVALLQKHGWKVVRDTGKKVIVKRPGATSPTSGDFNRELNWFSVFTTASVFTANKAYLPYGVYAVLECNGDYKAAARRLLDEGYGEKREYFGASLERDLYKKKREGMDREGLIKYLTNGRESKKPEEAEEIVDKLDKVWGEKICTFWDIDDKGKPAINRSRLMDFLHHEGGFSLYYHNNNGVIFKTVQCIDGFIEEVSTEHIKKYLKGYIQSLPDTFDGGLTANDLLELVLKGSSTYFSEDLLEFLNRSNFDFLKDTADVAYFPYRNGIVEVTKASITLKGYKELNKVIWKSQVKPYDITINAQLERAEYADFITCISGGRSTPEDPSAEDRYNYACTLIGYLLHTYKDPSISYAVVLAEETDDETKGGGTGKGIFLRGLSYMINMEKIDGKNFDPKAGFVWQRVGLDTKLVAIEDCRKNVDFEGFYSIITEGMTIDKKFKDQLYIPYQESPKIIFTTNYTISSSGNHGDRRKVVFEFSDFFGPVNTPRKHFGHLLFDGWDADELNRFFNYMFMCTQAYLSEGLLIVDQSDKLKRKELKIKYKGEFIQWWDNYLADDAHEWKMTSELYASFIAEFDMDKKYFSLTKFGNGLNDAAATVSKCVQRRRNTMSGKRMEVRIIDPGQEHVEIIHRKHSTTDIPF